MCIIRFQFPRTFFELMAKKTTNYRVTPNGKGEVGDDFGMRKGALIPCESYISYIGIFDFNYHL